MIECLHADPHYFKRRGAHDRRRRDSLNTPAEKGGACFSTCARAWRREDLVCKGARKTFRHSGTCNEPDVCHHEALQGT